MKQFYIITDKETENIIVTTDFLEMYEFILENTSSKIRLIDYNANPKILDRRVFLKTFFENTEESEKLYTLAKILIGHENNIRAFYNSLDMADEYKFRKTTNSII